jgi:hypothetical protein
MKRISNAAKKVIEESFRASIKESGQVESAFAEAGKGDVQEGNRVKVVLITEGLGNRVNMNYYGPEAIQSAPAIFEGKPCYLNHPSLTEEQDIPERRVEAKCGYFKNVRVEPINGVSSVTGELHFDLSETGTMGYQKALTSLHYKEDFPGVDAEYIGLSVNADGDVEKRMVDWQGETLEVNYVTKFTDAASCDIVTTPARGGKFLALVESIAGALNKEDTMKDGLKASLEKVRSLLKEATKEKSAEELRKKTAEAHKNFESFLKEAAEAEDEAKKESEGEGEAEKDPNPVKAGYEADMVCPHCGKPISNPKKEGEAEGEAEMCNSEGEGEGEGKKKEEESSDKNPPPADKKDDGDDDVIESRRLAVKALLSEAGLEKHLDVKDFEGKTLKEAKAEIEKISKIVEADRKEVFSKTGFVPAGFRDKVSESKKDIDADLEMAKILNK